MQFLLILNLLPDDRAYLNTLDVTEACFITVLNPNIVPVEPEQNPILLDGNNEARVDVAPEIPIDEDLVEAAAVAIDPAPAAVELDVALRAVGIDAETPPVALHNDQVVFDNYIFIVIHS